MSSMEDGGSRDDLAGGVVNRHIGNVETIERGLLAGGVVCPAFRVARKKASQASRGMSLMVW